ncbi:hypothetical protein AN958_05691 [Leucoagaricus sp. SymC.cos]|nr:hypothetical protein AN958_05691 [Leucoagaricus sp. SymC.cos]
MPKLFPGGRRKRLLCLLFLLVLCVPLVLLYYDTSYISELSPYLPDDFISYPKGSKGIAQFPSDDSTEILTEQDKDSENDSNTLCEPNECMIGSWKPREPPFRTLADIKREYPPSHRGVFKMCGSEENKRAEDSDRNAFHKAQEERLVQVMNWVWKPRKGRLGTWDAIEFVVRLLKCPGGLIFSGDSITRQQFQWVEYALAQADIRVTEDPSHLPSYSHKRLHQFILRPGDQMTAYLKDRAGVPDSRLRRPIYTKIDNHILIGEKEVREFSIPLGAKPDFPWYDIFEYFEGWESFVKDAARERGEDGVTEDTILVLSTGAHWSRGTWYMLPNTGGVPEQQLRVTIAFRRMIDLVMSKLDPIPKLSIFYRATAPGHPGCSSSAFYQKFRVNSTIAAQVDGDTKSRLFVDAETFYTSPYSDGSTAKIAMSNIREALELSTLDQQQKLVRSRWDWDRFEAHNAEWKQAIASREQLTNGVSSSDRATWFYMDIWNMALQRPDAHTQNLVDPSHENYDCLHWCVPAVVEEWTKYLNHLLFFNRGPND